ncbi:MAG TPA: HAD-IC family P-type ATPase [Natronosporangium sp.]
MPGQVTAAALGLTTAEVAQRTAAGQVNTAPARDTRTIGQILRANLLTRFNALIGALAVLILIFGHPVDALFAWVIVFNSGIGVVQEIRAKRTLDRLAVLARAPVRVRRDGRELSIPPEDVVLGDLILLAPGDKIPVDGEVAIAEELEIDESLLTGESDPVVKEPGEQVLSGSFVVAGAGAFTATKVGADAYAAKLVAEVSAFSLAQSELYQGINRFLKYLTWIIAPVGAVLVARQLTSDQSFPDAVVSSVAGVVPMIPEGLVLMTSVAFAVGVIRLGRRRCLVQELPAVEILARVDTLCLDKTGTLTEPGMVLQEIEYADGAPDGVAGVLAAMVAADPNPNQTMQAIGAGLPPPPDLSVTETIPFSSARKYSGVAFASAGSWLLGAADVLLAPGDPIRARAEALAADGLRVLALVQVPSLASEQRRAVALVVLAQKLRAAAADTLRWFAEQDVDAKVISGDNAVAVGAIARQLGLAGADRPVDARQLPDDPAPLAEALERHSVFGRVTPHQKRSFVGALQSRGHLVAMTGDGVNDVLALKDADLGIAMGSGSGASRAVAKVVLLDDDFTVLPAVLGEGRRVLANIERVANLFLTKTVYSLVLGLSIAIAGLPFLMLPRHGTLINAVTIGIPAFFLALAPSNERARGGFVPRVLRFAIPAGIICALASFTAYLIARSRPELDTTGQRSVATITLFLVAFFVLVLIARPLALWKLGLLAAMATGFGLVLAVPAAREVASLQVPEPSLAAVIIALAAGAAVLLVVVRSLLARWLPSRDR